MAKMNEAEIISALIKAVTELANIQNNILFDKIDKELIMRNAKLRIDLLDIFEDEKDD